MVARCMVRSAVAPESQYNPLECEHLEGRVLRWKSQLEQRLLV